MNRQTSGAASKSSNALASFIKFDKKWSRGGERDREIEEGKVKLMRYLTVSGFSNYCGCDTHFEFVNNF